MEIEERRLLLEIREGISAQNRSLIALINALKLASSLEAEMLRQILDAVTKPLPESKVPELLGTIIQMLSEQGTTVTWISQVVEELSLKASAQL